MDDELILGLNVECRLITEESVEITTDGTPVSIAGVSITVGCAFFVTADLDFTGFVRGFKMPGCLRVRELFGYNLN